MVKAGFTSSRKGLTIAQEVSLHALIHLVRPEEWHHGDCVGGDKQSHGIASGAGCYMVGHPPVLEVLRAFCEFDEIREPKDYLTRDREMVDEIHVLFAGPNTTTNKPRSGTWYTMNYAVKQNVPVIVVFPNGSIADYKYHGGD